MSRFYHLDPARILDLPLWMVDSLIRQQPKLEAEEMLRDIVIAMLPSLKPIDRRRIVWRLERAARARPAIEPPAIIRHDPAAAREWFANQGAKVI